VRAVNAGLARARDAGGLCTQCGACRAGCPTFDLRAEEERSGRGRLNLAQAVLKGLERGSTSLDAALSSCLRCGFCDAVCPTGVPVSGTIAEARAALGHRLPLRIRMLAQPGLVRLLRPWVVLLQRLSGGRWPSGLPPLPRRRARRRLARRVAFDARSAVPVHLGCRVDHLVPGIAEAAFALADRLGQAWHLPPSPRCSGDIAGAVAPEESRPRLLGAPPTVTFCAGCRRGLRARGEDPEEASEILARAALEQGLRLAPAPPERLHVHRPCADREGTKPPRHFLELLRRDGYAVRLVEHPACCGGALPALASHSEDSHRLGQAFLSSLGEGRLLSPAPGCLLHLGPLAAAAGVTVEHPVSFLARSLLPGPQSPR
jgi:glycolate oxidase iron-sulfur subunit